MDVINADLRDNYASSRGSVVSQHTAGQQNSNSVYGGVQNGGKGEQSAGLKRVATPRKQYAKKQLSTQGIYIFYCI